MVEVWDTSRMTTRATRCKVAALTNEKGGIGKTTGAVNLAAILSAPPHGKRVLLLDLDPQGHASESVGMRDDTKNAPVINVLYDGEPLAEHVRKTEFGFDILAGGRKFAMAALDVSGAVIENMKKMVEQLGGYDLCLIDCPPQLGPLSLAALNVADHVMVPLPLEYLPYDGFCRLLAQMEITKKQNPKLKLGALWACWSDERGNLAKEIKGKLLETCGDAYVDSPIRRNIRLAEAPATGKPVAVYDPSCNGTQDYVRLAAALEQRGLV
jgi:chromosome partitioning protein